MRNALRTIVRIVGPLMIFAIVPFSPGGTSTTEAGTGTLVVDTTADGGGGSFRQALETAGGTAGPDTITFDPTVFPPDNPATINANATYEVEAPAASDPLTISALGAGVIFDFTGVTEGAAAFHFKPDGPIDGLTLKNFTIQNFTSDTNHEGHGVEIGFAPTSVSNLVIEGLTITGMSADGLFLNADENFSGIIEDNDIRQNDGVGIHISSGTTSGLFIQNNDVVGNGSKGIDLDVVDPAVASTAFIVQNLVTDNGNDGIFVAGPETTNAIHATISQNSTSGNGGLGINLLGFGNEFDGITENDIGDTDAGANDLLNFPVLTIVGETSIVGTACDGCTIELFLADSDPTDHGEGAEYLATGTAVGGNFDITACASEGDEVTATATDALGNTSEFALNYVLPASTCSGILLNGDLDCDGDVDARDVLIAFIYQAEATQLSQEPDCPSVGSSFAPVAFPAGSIGPTIFGDVNCNDSVDTGDGITLLQHLAEVSLDPEPPGSCTPIGEPLPQLQ